MRKQTRRKVYPLTNPIAMAIHGAAVLPEQDLDKLRIQELASIDAFAAGSATAQDWHHINAMMTICRQMANHGVGPEAIEACDAAAAALRSDWNRFEATGKMGASGTTLKAYRDLFAYHDLQRQSISRSEYESHVRKTINKVKSGKQAS